MSVDLSQLLTIPEASKRTPLTEGQLRGWIDRNYLPHVRWGGGPSDLRPASAGSTAASGSATTA